MHQNTHIHGTHRQCLCACADGCTPKGRGSHHNVQDTYIVLYAEQKHENTCWLRICAPRTQVLPHTCMPLRVFMMGMAFRNSGSRQLLLDAAVERDDSTAWHPLAWPRPGPLPAPAPRPPQCLQGESGGCVLCSACPRSQFSHLYLREKRPDVSQDLLNHGSRSTAFPDPSLFFI